MHKLMSPHGDADHMGEALNIVSNMKVENVIFNCGSLNNLEKNMINVLEKKKTKYSKCINELNDKFNFEDYKIKNKNINLCDIM